MRVANPGYFLSRCIALDPGYFLASHVSIPGMYNLSTRRNKTEGTIDEYHNASHQSITSQSNGFVLSYSH